MTKKEGVRREAQILAIYDTTEKKKENRNDTDLDTIKLDTMNIVQMFY